MAELALAPVLVSLAPAACSSVVVCDEGARLGVSSEVSVEAQLFEAAYAFSQLESSRGSWQFPCSARQAQAENRTVPTPRDPHWATRTASASADSSALLLLSHHRPPFSPPCAGRPGGSGGFSAFAFLAAAFWGFAFLVLLPFWALPFWHCCLFGLPPPPAACSARPSGVALSISHLYPACLKAQREAR